MSNELVRTPDRDEVARLAYRYWEERGCPHGDHDVDWYRAEMELQIQRPDLKSDTSAERIVVGVFRSIDDARKAYEELQREGFTSDEVGFIANEAIHKEASRPSSTSGAPNASEPSDKVAADASIGAAIGGIGGLLLGFAGLAVPGVGPVLVAGPLLVALGGAGLGAAAGGLIGALTEKGVPEDQARNYAEGVRRGDVLITVHARGERADRAAAIMDRNNAVNIDDRVESWRERGWKGHDGTATPLSASEMNREREYARKTTSSRTSAEAQNARDEQARSSRVYDRVPS